MKKLNNQEIKKCESEMLQILTKFFRENDITYFIAYGTFLGSVRHKGFIPWDDDIDLLVPRKDYNKLIKLLSDRNEILDSKYRGIGFELGNSDWPFIKMINCNIELHSKNKIDEFLWIDIFPLDSLPNKRCKSYRRKMMILFDILSLMRCAKYNYKSLVGLSGFVKKIMLLFLSPFNYENFISFFIRQSSKYCNKCNDAFSMNVWIPSIKEFYLKEEMKEKEYIFEKNKYIGMESYDTILTRLYGNYMELPPEGKRISHDFDAYDIEG